MIVCVTKHLFRIIDSLIYHHSRLSTRLVNLPWDGVDPLHRQWFNGLRQPDNPTLSCCGKADAYWADSYEVNDDQCVAIITDAATTNRYTAATWGRIAMSSMAMKLKLIVAILVIAAVPVCAQAQPPSAAKVTKADAQKVLKIISEYVALMDGLQDIDPNSQVGQEIGSVLGALDKLCAK